MDKETAGRENVTFEQMQIKHLDQIMQIENLSFPTPWTKNAFEYELRENDFAHYIVALAGGRIVAGYAGMWVVLDEAHVTNIAVHRDQRGHGLGIALMLELFKRAIMLGVQRMTLEVRPSNAPARALYAHLGFKEQGLRKNYYSDTKEDAIIMWKNDLTQIP
ncbi:ribosomal protein S18-alanine N-acetyltransferase [Desulfoscipio gibsoniae]|uniref:Ribosomal-protein-alanine acetyltransferase n=1 Tax=Desulfoscipio gibsoniae DSM 7213 TaxID=767817 RepID=R4KF02_9FIRM|nr:ribosomal protein S18-alanine N-acetyltransferase [Desulfoscipio gibsoniae]AGL01768.1 ribosomal-protein-alanine acetyltransferase [Desulfoscipio gibsoniae DSM 7213]